MVKKTSHTQSKRMNTNTKHAPEQLDLEEFIQKMPAQTLVATVLQPMTV